MPFTIGVEARLHESYTSITQRHLQSILGSRIIRPNEPLHSISADEHHSMSDGATSLRMASLLAFLEGGKNVLSPCRKLGLVGGVLVGVDRACWLA